MAAMSMAEAARIAERGKLSMCEALALVMNDGKRARRAGWQERDRWIAYEPGMALVHSSSFQSPANKAYVEDRGGWVPVLACITMKKPCGGIMLGWTPTQTDMTVVDWYILEPGE